MKHKYIVILGIVVIAAILFLTFGFPKPDESLSDATISGSAIENNKVTEGVEVPVNKETSSFSFEGFGPGKSHIGTFNEYSAFLIITEDEIIGLKGTIVVDSVTTEIDKLTEHLKSDDFFDAAKYPEIKFVSQEIKDGKMIGELTFRGITKSISFPVTVEESGIKSTFVLNTAEFGMETTFAEEDVVINFDFRE